MSFAIALGAASPPLHSMCNCCTPLVATLCAVPSCLVIALSCIVMWSALVLLIAPGLGDVRSHSSQTVGFAHSESSTVWTACPACSICYPCIPAMRVISCSLKTDPSKEFFAIWPNLAIAKMLVLLTVLLLPQLWGQQAEIWALMNLAAQHSVTIETHNLACSTYTHNQDTCQV